MPQQILRKDIEYIIHCDKQGTIIGPISKVHAHLPGVRTTLTHYSTWSMIFNPKTGKYGIQFKNPRKQDRLTAGKWDMGVAGHNCYVKERNTFKALNFNENLIKEAKEEIGITIEMAATKAKFLSIIRTKPNQSVGYIFKKFHYQTTENNEWVGLGFIILPSEKVTFKDKEVTDFKWLLPSELKEFLEKNTNYCSPLPLVFEKAEQFRKTNILPTNS